MSNEIAQRIQNAQMIFKPQPGGQTMFLASNAYFTIYGGAAGGGKSYAMILSALRYHEISGFNAVTFRRELKQVKDQGGLWDESHQIYPWFGATPNGSTHRWTFDSSASIGYAGLEAETDKFKWKSAQICQLNFEQIEDFSETQFRYMMTRNRSACGVRPHVQATCNPDPDSWIKQFVNWYLLPSGLPDPEKRGIVRYFVSVEDRFVFGESTAYLAKKHGVLESNCKSYTFIYATLDDNPKLLERSPDYVSNLMVAGESEAKSLLDGNWNVRKTGKLFKMSDFQIFTMVPRDFEVKIITMDTAQKTEDAHDYSVMQCWVLSQKGIYLIDQVRDKFEFPDLEIIAESFIKRHQDCKEIYIEDKVSGTSLVQSLKRKVRKPIVGLPRSQNKQARSVDAQRYVKSGYVFVNPMLLYYIDFMNEVLAFNAEGTHKNDDQCDCFFDAVDVLLANPRYRLSTDEGNEEEGGEMIIKPTWLN